MVEEIKTEIERYFADKRYRYHSLEHSLAVYEAVTTIAKKENIPDRELELLQIAALFHDTGYAENPPNHEELSAKIASDYLKKKEVDLQDIETVKETIKSTKVETEPTDQLQRIIKDADLSHLGHSSFSDKTSKLKSEKESIIDQALDKELWTENNITFLKNHKWYTKSAKKLYNKEKKKNLALEKAKLKSIIKEQKKQKPEKGVETMYRVALRNHNQLSKIADNKANILLSITAIMLSLILSNLATKIDSNPQFLVPTILIIAVNIITMFFAILATRPKVSTAPYTRENFLNNKVNILFFGNFYKMPLEEFEWGMNHLQGDRDLLYNSLSKDLYFLGSVLAKKYRYLQIAYVVFMGGLLVSTIAFVWCLMA